MPDDVSNNIPFSLGLEVLPATAFQLINGSNDSSSSSYSSPSSNYGSPSTIYSSPSAAQGSSSTIYGSSSSSDSSSSDGSNRPNLVYKGSSSGYASLFPDDGLVPSDGPIMRFRQRLLPKIKDNVVELEEDGVYVKGESLKQVYIEMSIFQSFPVQLENNEYTYIPDELSGNSSGELSGGRCGFCDKFDESILWNQVSRGTNNFKVGARIGHNKGMEYLRKFYPNVSWNENDFAKLEKAGFFLAEMLIPAGGSSLQPVRCTLVDNGPNDKWAIQVMGAFCSLDIFKNLFKIKATKAADDSVHIIGDTIKFPFADKAYDYKNGEIIGYSPTAILDWLTNRECTVSTTSPFKGSYSGECINGSKIRVKFYIDPSNREAAQQKVEKDLPDALFEPTLFDFQEEPKRENAQGEGENAQGEGENEQEKTTAFSDVLLPPQDYMPDGELPF